MNPPPSDRDKRRLDEKIAQLRKAIEETQAAFYSTQRLLFDAQEQIASSDQALKETQDAFYNTQRLLFDAQDQIAARDQALKETQAAFYSTQALLFDAQEEARRYRLALLDSSLTPPPPRRAQDLTPSIIFNAVPKTAGLYISRTLAKGLGYDSVEICLNIFPGAAINHRALDMFLKGDCICHHHMEATELNLWYVARHKTRLTLHVRDLRSVMISWVHHLTATGNAAAMGGHPLIAPSQEFFERPFAWRMDWAIDTQLPVYVNFIDGWLKAHSSGKVDLLITTYEQFVQDSDAFYRRILDFFEIPHSRFKDPTLEKTHSLNFRAGNPDEWRSVMTEEQVARLTRAVPDEWWSRFGWTAPDRSPLIDR